MSPNTTYKYSFLTNCFLIIKGPSLLKIIVTTNLPTMVIMVVYILFLASVYSARIGRVNKSRTKSSYIIR